MSTNQTPPTGRQNPNDGRKWWLPAILALLIIAILAIAFFATHPHVFGGSATSTPTATVTSTPTPQPATPTPGTAPTATPQPGPTGTPRPGPTGTPRPGPTATPASTVQTGPISYPQSQVNSIQQGANRNDPAYTLFLDPRQSAMHDLPHHGFNGSFSIVSPAAPPAPTATPYTNPQGQPETQFAVQYNGKKYLVILTQLAQKGPKGIWLITTIKAI